MATSISGSLSSTCPSDDADGTTSRQSDSGHSDSPPAPSFAKKKRPLGHIDSKYQPEWSLKYQGIKRSKRGPTYAFCSLCSMDISVAVGGVHQIKRHCANKRHSNRTAEISSQPTITEVARNQSDARMLSDQVCHAELCFTRFVAEHNLPFAVADHFNALVPIIFPDSNIAAEFACARTKTAALITHALAPAANEPVVSFLTKQPFTVLCDGGNDNFEKKYFGVMVRFWDEQLRKVVTRFLDAPVCNIATGETLFIALADTLKTRQIPWKNLIGFASDSASVMVGKRNSVLSRVISKQPNVFFNMPSCCFVCCSCPKEATDIN